MDEKKATASHSTSPKAYTEFISSQKRDLQRVSSGHRPSIEVIE